MTDKRQWREGGPHVSGLRDEVGGGVTAKNKEIGEEGKAVGSSSLATLGLQFLGNVWGYIQEMGR